MSYSDLPATVKAMMADERIRTHHHLWHFVRNQDNWEQLGPAEQTQLEAEHWKAPRFDQAAGSGVDFLGMHRQMIHMVNGALATADDPAWPAVVGWDPIPWAENDPDWPVPVWPVATPPWATPAQWASFTQTALSVRTAVQRDEMQRIAARLGDPARLKAMSLDALGTAMEWSIHGWMHIRWSGASYDDAFSTDVGNDWLFLPWSSHVNRHFWKLHGWIDRHIGLWEAASGQVADLTLAWAGPPGMGHHGMHMASTELLALLPPRHLVPMPMRIRREVVDQILR